MHTPDPHTPDIIKKFNWDNYQCLQYISYYGDMILLCSWFFSPQTIQKTLKKQKCLEHFLRHWSLPLPVLSCNIIWDKKVFFMFTPVTQYGKLMLTITSIKHSTATWTIVIHQTQIFIIDWRLTGRDPNTSGLNFDQSTMFYYFLSLHVNVTLESIITSSHFTHLTLHKYVKVASWAHSVITVINLIAPYLY